MFSGILGFIIWCVIITIIFSIVLTIGSFVIGGMMMGFVAIWAGISFVIKKIIGLFKKK